MKCVICNCPLSPSKTGEVCSRTECIDKWLKSGHGSVSGDEYKQYIERCHKAELKKEQENA